MQFHGVVPVTASTQFELDFQPGLLDQFATFGDVVRASVYGCGKQLKSIAADLDLSSSELSRMLSSTESLHFPVERLDELIGSTGDLRPIFWLVEKRCEDSDAKKKRAVNDLLRLMPLVHNALKAAQE